MSVNWLCTVLFCSVLLHYIWLFFVIGASLQSLFWNLILINTQPVVMTAIDSIYIVNNSKQFLSRLKIHSSPHHLEAHLPTNIYLTLLLHILDCPVVFLFFNGFVAVNHFIVWKCETWHYFSRPFLTCLRCLSAPGPSRRLDRTHQLFWEEVLL